MGMKITRRSWMWMSAVAIAAVAIFAAYHFSVVQQRVRAYGNAPGLFAVIADETEQGWCERIEGASPPVHYNLWGEVWQDPHLKWEDVEIRGRGERILEHGRTGPVERGHIVCGFTSGSWEWVYTPREEMLFARS